MVVALGVVPAPVWVSYVVEPFAFFVPLIVTLFRWCQQFVSYFYRHIREKNIFEIHSMYETSFNKLSDRYFKQSPWPHWEAIAPLVDDDHVFLLLYKV